MNAHKHIEEIQMFVKIKDVSMLLQKIVLFDFTQVWVQYRGSTVYKYQLGIELTFSYVLGISNIIGGLVSNCNLIND